MIVKTDPCQEISRHVIPHHLAHDFVFFCSISIFQLKKNHVSPGICHHSEFWSWLTKVIILHHLTLEWFGTHMWAPRCFLPSHPFTVPSGSIEQTKRERSAHYEILMVISWACLLGIAQTYLLLKKGPWYPQRLPAPAIVNRLGPRQEHRTSLSPSTAAAGKKHVGV